MATKHPKNSSVRGTTARITEERLIRLRHQNQKLNFEVQKLTGQVGDIDKMKREVLAANAVVKQQLLAVPFRLMATLTSISEPREIARVLHEALVEALNDLAYERELYQSQPGTCPVYGAKEEAHDDHTPR